jgi:hypothetical protein
MRTRVTPARFRPIANNLKPFASCAAQDIAAQRAHLPYCGALSSFVIAHEILSISAFNLANYMFLWFKAQPNK